MDTFKIIVIIFLIMLSYQVYVLNKIQYEPPETFENAEQSIGGVDDQNSINTLAQIAKQLMAGGATVPGNLSIKGEIDATGGIKLGGGITAGGRNILAELDKLNARWDGDTLIAAGGIHLANKWGLYDTGDDWIRVNNIKARGTNDYRGGVAVANLWSRDTQHLPQYVRFNQNVSARPNPDPGRVFDFGSQGRTTVDNGWSIMQLIPR
jgi:hypothetical protein